MAVDNNCVTEVLRNSSSRLDDIHQGIWSELEIVRLVMWKTLPSLFFAVQNKISLVMFYQRQNCYSEDIWKISYGNQTQNSGEYILLFRGKCHMSTHNHRQYRWNCHMAIERKTLASIVLLLSQVTWRHAQAQKHVESVLLPWRKCHTSLFCCHEKKCQTSLFCCLEENVTQVYFLALKKLSNESIFFILIFFFFALKKISHESIVFPWRKCHTYHANACNILCQCKLNLASLPT